MSFIRNKKVIKSVHEAFELSLFEVIAVKDILKAMHLILEAPLCQILLHITVLLLTDEQNATS